MIEITKNIKGLGDVVIQYEAAADPEFAALICASNNDGKILKIDNHIDSQDDIQITDQQLADIQDAAQDDLDLWRAEELYDRSEEIRERSTICYNQGLSY